MFYIYCHAVYIPETAPPDTYIAYVEAYDPDVDVNQKVGIFIEHQEADAENFFVIQNGNYLATTQNLDRETYNDYRVDLKACDQASPNVYVSLCNKF